MNTVTAYDEVRTDSPALHAVVWLANVSTIHSIIYKGKSYEYVLVDDAWCIIWH